MNEPMKTMFSQGIHDQSATAKERVGALRIMEDGRKFRYCKNGAVALVAGIPTEAAAAVANHVNCAVAVAASVGDMSVSITVGATAVTADQYKDGYLQINDGAGEGLQYRISSHPAHAGSGTLVVQLLDPIRVALTTAASKASLIYNPFSLVVAATGGSTAPTGIPPIAVTASYYFWSQTGGLGCAYVANGVALGQRLTNGNGLLDVGADDVEPIVGYSVATAGVTTQYKPVMLTID